jgi:hypothetical protein
MGEQLEKSIAGARSGFWVRVIHFDIAGKGCGRTHDHSPFRLMILRERRFSHHEASLEAAGELNRERKANQ